MWSIKSSWRDWILSLSSPERWRERAREGLGCAVVLFDKLKEGSAGQETAFSHTFPCRPC